LALRDADRSVTYAEFDARTNGVAQRLLEQGGDAPLIVVAPLGIPSMELLYGGVKAGRLVVPLDPRWPREQWLAVAKRTHGQLVVPDDATRARLPALGGRSPLLAPDLLAGEAADPHLAIDPEAPAFVFFTSGSTGAPKGTIAGHGMAVGVIEMYDVVPDDRLCLVAPLSFITGALAAVGVLLTGASGHFFDIMNADLATLPGWLIDNEITLMGLNVTAIGMIANALNQEGRTVDSLRFVGHGGEAGSPQHFAECRRAFPNAEFGYGYGMTETSSATDHRIGSTVEPEGGPMPVGRPVPSVEIDIVDDSGQHVRDGETGEIWVTGRRVALGYWDEPALTAERFIFHADGRRTVRTGDLGRWRPDGLLEYVGRNDQRIKVHGQLVDLSLVEHELKQLPRVRDAAVSAVPTDDGGHRVVAHVIVDDDQVVTVGELRRGLAPRLPPYAIPRAFFRLKEMPRTHNDKVDRERLRESAVGALPLESPFVAPRDDRERAVAAQFAAVLGVDDVGAHDDFFELGGDSLSVVELLAGLADDLDLHLSANELLEEATVEAVAARLGRAQPGPERLLVRVNRVDGPPLYCVPGAGDTPVQLRPLGRRLPGVAVHAFAYRGIDRRALPDRTVAAIARRNLTGLRRQDSSGSYRLLGFSFGGTVALEMAQQLVAAGDEVDLLVLLEPAFVLASPSLAARARAHTAEMQTVAADAHPGPDLRARVSRAAALAHDAFRYARARARYATAGVVVRHGLAQHRVFLGFHEWMIRAYRPRPYAGRTVVIGAPGYFEQMGRALDVVLGPASDTGSRRDVQVVNARHSDLVREPSVAEVAYHLEQVLDAQTWHASQ
jgi:acyl-CoA synthetase (AMP-forming)/AMP-acid ligase II/thioesterase domain-containing protein/acyl carrier protein